MEYYNEISALAVVGNYEALIGAVVVSDNDAVVLMAIADHFDKLVKTNNIRNLTKLACIFARTQYVNEYRHICVRIKAITGEFNKPNHETF